MMIPYDVDPSLYTAEPESPVLDDGFSPPHRIEPAPAAENSPAVTATEPKPALPDKSLF